jgi:uncharacterized protein
MLGGWLLRRFDPQDRLMQYLLQAPSTASKTSKDIVLPNSVVAGVSLIGLIVFSIMGCYVFYPKTRVACDTIHDLHASIVSAVAGKEWENASFLIPQQKDWLHKLVVGRYLRGEPWSRHQAMRMKVLLSKLEMLEHECEHRDVAEAKRWSYELRIAHRRLFETVPKSP